MKFRLNFQSNKRQKIFLKKVGSLTLEIVQVKYKTGPYNSEFNRFNSVSQKAGVIQKRSHYATIHLPQVN